MDQWRKITMMDQMGMKCQDHLGCLILGGTWMNVAEMAETWMKSTWMKDHQGNI